MDIKKVVAIQMGRTIDMPMNRQMKIYIYIDGETDRRTDRWMD